MRQEFVAEAGTVASGWTTGRLLLVIISWLGTMHTFAGCGLSSRSLLASP
jgi:hypothetical protein